MNRKTIIERVASPYGEIIVVEMVNRKGASLKLSSLGAGIVGIAVPDRYGNMADVVIGYDNPSYYMADGPCAGKIPGRYANRIAGGRFALDGVEYRLAVNNGPNALHGGPTGFQNRLWSMELVGDDAVRFSRVSEDGEEGYPGTLNVSVTYCWADDNSLSIGIVAETDKPTVVNLTSHGYFNLAGHNAGSALRQMLKLNASRYLPTDETLVPTGEMASVDGTPMDFRTMHEIGRDINADFTALKYGKGYDNCWLIDGYRPGNIQLAACLYDPVSGRLLEVETDQPGVQVYTGNWLKGSPIGKGGYEYQDCDAVAIECQALPDSPNHPEFPSTRLNPGEIYSRRIILKFKTCSEI